MNASYIPFPPPPEAKLHRVFSFEHEKSPSLAPTYHRIILVTVSLWFTRLWVIQELALATKATFMAGAAMLPFPLFQAALFWINRGYYHSTVLHEVLHEVLDFEALEQATSMILCSTPNFNVLGLMVLTKNAQCLDPRVRLKFSENYFLFDMCCEMLLPSSFGSKQLQRNCSNSEL